MKRKPRPNRPLIWSSADPTVVRIVPELAKEIGLKESIVLVQIGFWITTADNKNFRDGDWWTYQSYRDMRLKGLGFFPIGSLHRIIQKLVEKQYIKIGNYNTASFDETNWYALNLETLSKLKSIKIMVADEDGNIEEWSRLFQNGTAPFQNGTDASLDLFQNGTTIPENPEITANNPADADLGALTGEDEDYSSIGGSSVNEDEIQEQGAASTQQTPFVPRVSPKFPSSRPAGKPATKPAPEKTVLALKIEQALGGKSLGKEAREKLALPFKTVDGSRMIELPSADELFVTNTLFQKYVEAKIEYAKAQNKPASYCVNLICKYDAKGYGWLTYKVEHVKDVPLSTETGYSGDLPPDDTPAWRK
jgi:hypothetical protein